MNVIGWLFITVLGLYLAGIGLIGAYVSHGWSGKTEPACWVIAAVGAGVLFFSYTTFHFEVSLKP